MTEFKSHQYHTEEAFLTAFKGFMPVYADLTPADIIRLGIKKDDDCYHRYQFMALIDAIQKERVRTYVETYSTEDRSDEELSEDYPIVHLDKIVALERTAQIQAYNFSLLLLDEEFRNFIHTMRNIYRIPDVGIKTHEDSFSHFTKLAKQWNRSGFTKNADMAFVHDALAMQADAYLTKHVMFYDRGSKNQIFYYELLYDYIVFDDPFLTITELQKEKQFFKRYSSGQVYGLRVPSIPQNFSGECIEVHIAIYADTPKKDVHQLIDRLWKEQIEYYQKKNSYGPKIQRVKDRDKLFLKWKIYKFHLDGLSYKQITKHCSEKSETNIGKIISEVKKEIVAMKKVNTPPYRKLKN